MNNHYGGYGPGTADIFRQNMHMEKLSLENVDITKISRDVELETRLNLTSGRHSKGKQTTMSDFS